MDLERIRGDSIRTARQFGLEVPASLPVLGTGLAMRSADETISRILAMTAVAAIAYGFERAKAIQWLNQEGVIDSLSKEEKKFLLEGEGQPVRFQAQIEAIWALCWAMGIVSEMNFGKDCDSSFATILPNLKQRESTEAFRKKAHPRSLDQVVAACDLAYCLHWGIREANAFTVPQAVNLKSYVVVERRWALEWLLSRDTWDETSLDT